MSKNKTKRIMLDELSKMVGEDHAMLLLAGLLDAMDNATKGKEYIEVRSLKLVINDYFEYEVIGGRDNGHD